MKHHSCSDALRPVGVIIVPAAGVAFSFIMVGSVAIPTFDVRDCTLAVPLPLDHGATSTRRLRPILGDFATSHTSRMQLFSEI